jgi:hypothetical protein
MVKRTFECLAKISGALKDAFIGDRFGNTQDIIPAPQFLLGVSNL